MAKEIFKDLEFDGKAIKHARLVDCVLPSGKSVEEVEKKTEETAESAGKLDELETEDKSSLVSAINELKALVDTLSQTVETFSEKIEGVTIDLSAYEVLNETDVTAAIPLGYIPKANDEVIISGGHRYIFAGASVLTNGSMIITYGGYSASYAGDEILLTATADAASWTATNHEI